MYCKLKVVKNKMLLIKKVANNLKILKELLNRIKGLVWVKTAYNILQKYFIII